MKLALVSQYIEQAVLCYVAPGFVEGGNGVDQQIVQERCLMSYRCCNGRAL